MPPCAERGVELCRRACSARARCPRPRCRRRRSCRPAGSRPRGRRRTRVPRSVVTMPPVPKLGSSVPSGVVADEREVAVDAAARVAKPATTILPSGCTATALAWSPPPRMSVLTIPPCRSRGRACRRARSGRRRSPASGRPRRRCGRRRRSRRRGAAPRRRPRRRRRRGRWWRSRSVPKLWSRLPAASWRVSAKSLPAAVVRQPAVTMPPPGWITTASPWPPPTGVETRPSLPNVRSRPDGVASVSQWTATSVTSALPTVPVPCWTVQTWSGLCGCVLTATS